MALILAHAWTGLGLLRGTFFVLLAFALGLAAEIVGVKTGLIFGGRYAYAPGSTPVFMDVPLLIPIFWTAFISTGYGLVNSLLAWPGKGKPNRGNVGVLFLAVALDGLSVVAIDIIMDPLQVDAGNWQWLQPGCFYGVPWGNFTGWFLVVMVISGISRTADYYFPGRSGMNPSALLISAASYALLGLVLASFALKSGKPWLSLIGLGVMLPLALAGLYRSWKRAALLSSETPAKNQH
jgi:putative membrane protein